jgi:hypothetical protein
MSEFEMTSTLSVARVDCENFATSCLKRGPVHLFRKGIGMKKNVEFIEVVVHYNRIKIIFASSPE